jgi:hypothetical protein
VSVASHLYTLEQRCAGLRRVCTEPANEDNSKWTRRGADALFFEGIEECAEVTDSDLRVFVFGHAYGRDTQGPYARVVLGNRFLERRRIGHKVLMLDRGKLGMRR